MEILGEIKEILIEILDLEDQEITPETYLVRELDVESIDLLELAVALNSRFNIEVSDDDIFLKKFRLYVTEAEQQETDTFQYVTAKLPFLTKNRAEEIITDLDEGPALKVKDLISYVMWERKDESWSQDV